MTPDEVARSYDVLAEHWASERFPQHNGIAAHRRAVGFAPRRGKALDVGCGGSGRIIALLLEQGFDAEGVDLSERMLELARRRHPGVTFYRADVCQWQVPGRYGFISAWDSIWHVPLGQQEAVLRKLLAALAPEGVCIFTIGGLDAPGEKQDAAMGVPMYHAALGIPKTLEVVAECGCVCRHLEYDQYLQQHVYLIVQKRS